MDFLALNNPWQSCLLLLVTIPSLKCMSQLFVSPQASQEPPCLALPPLVTFFLTCLWLLQSQHLQPHHIQLLPASSQAEVASQPKPSPSTFALKPAPAAIRAPPGERQILSAGSSSSLSAFAMSSILKKKKSSWPSLPLSLPPFPLLPFQLKFLYSSLWSLLPPLAFHSGFCLKAPQRAPSLCFLGM